ATSRRVKETRELGQLRCAGGAFLHAGGQSIWSRGARAGAVYDTLGPPHASIVAGLLVARRIRSVGCRDHCPRDCGDALCWGAARPSRNTEPRKFDTDYSLYKSALPAAMGHNQEAG